MATAAEFTVLRAALDGVPAHGVEGPAATVVESPLGPATSAEFTSKVVYGDVASRQ